MSKTVFIVGTVWVEPKSSAAGSRMLQLIQFFQAENYQVVFGTIAQRNPNSLDLESLGVSTHNLELNNSSFDDLIKSLNPEIVVFDRFMTEEQFGWRVSECCPKAIRILDTEDLHCLRKTREKKYKAKETFQLSDLLSEDITKREIASILRCDLSLMISQFELQALKEVFKIDASILFYLPFLLKDVTIEENLPSFENRAHFISIGNFFHSPNLEGVVSLKKEIWPGIRKQLPKAELHVYGAYPIQQVLEFHNPKEGFFVHGFVDNQHEVFQKARVLLAPLSFGAGLKGKFIDAMKNGCPSVTTSIGIEGYSDSENWSGLVADDFNDFIEKSIQLYQDETVWNSSIEKGKQLLKMFDKTSFYSNFSSKVSSLQSNLEEHRKENFFGSMLQNHTLQSTKYLSKWIEAKNRN